MSPQIHFFALQSTKQELLILCARIGYNP